MPYGYGIVYPILDRVNKYLQADKDLHTIMSRKANAQIVATLGFPPSPEMPTGNIPTDGDIQAYGKKMEWMNNKREWVTGPNVNMKVLDFGNIGDKFAFVLKNDDQFIIEALQVPEVLMGRGDIAEGLAKVQMEAFMKFIHSLQAFAEKPIEMQIFARILEANGLGGVHVEFEWGVPSETERNDSIDRYGRLLQLQTLDGALRHQIELKLANKLEIDEEDLEGPDAEKQRELRAPQPIVPGQNEKAVVGTLEDI